MFYFHLLPPLEPCVKCWLTRMVLPFCFIWLIYRDICPAFAQWEQLWKYLYPFIIIQLLTGRHLPQAADLFLWHHIHVTFFLVHTCVKCWFTHSQCYFFETLFPLLSFKPTSWPPHFLLPVAVKQAMWLNINIPNAGCGGNTAKYRLASKVLWQIH